MKNCLVVFALPEHQWSWPVVLEEQGTIDDALRMAREQAVGIDVPWETAEVGIFGEASNRAMRPRDGDRIEIYRPLTADPKESRRARAAARKSAPDQASAPPPSKPAR